ncbi:MAG: methyltransferase domain-containing protein [Syntrophomonadaceae bacterium]|jgi:cyclopropane fatty-acyl-phospholipid synthase-like methyltransferase|nr:methyltransferase domain-containing protein [Syntrophomonadaceae bacterium]
MSFRNAVNLSHLCVKMRVKPDDTVVDATCGNGHDTLFLAQIVTRGRVLAFDISPLAIANTAARLKEHGVSHRVELCQEDFRNLRAYVRSPVAAIMFNLGYLPGASRETATKAEHSREAVETAVNLVRPGGVVTVVCYPGHQGGAEETHEILAVTGGLSQKEFEVLKVDFLNQAHNPPLLVAVYRLEGDRA